MKWITKVNVLSPTFSYPTHKEKLHVKNSMTISECNFEKHFFSGLLSNSMLYGVQNNDTAIWTNDSDRSYRILVVNVKNLPYSICPLAYIGHGPAKKVCEKLALIYSKPMENTASGTNYMGQNQPLSRKMSRTVSYNAEKHLISEINMVAVVPVP